MSRNKSPSSSHSSHSSSPLFFSPIHSSEDANRHLMMRNSRRKEEDEEEGRARKKEGRKSDPRGEPKVTADDGGAGRHVGVADRRRGWDGSGGCGAFASLLFPADDIDATRRDAYL